MTMTTVPTVRMLTKSLLDAEAEVETLRDLLTRVLREDDGDSLSSATIHAIRLAVAR